MKNLEVQNSIRITAEPAQVWDALVNPEKTKIYMFGCEAVSDWKPGSYLLWRGLLDGEEVIFVKGTVMEYKPYFLLKYTVIDPNADMEDIPENYLNVTYELAEHAGYTHLTVTQDGFENAQDGDKRYQDVYNKGLGWTPVLEKIKELVENE